MLLEDSKICGTKVFRTDLNGEIMIRISSKLKLNIDTMIKWVIIGLLQNNKKCDIIFVLKKFQY